VDLLGAMNFTAEQQAAIDRRSGDLLLDAGAGSGKTRVLTERFARSVEEDGIAIAEILTITFTDKAAAELRERIRLRLREGSAADLAIETESAWISTIHGFCARVLRTHALQAGIDPQFTVLDGPTADELADAAFAAALSTTAATVAGAALISNYGVGQLQTSVRAVYEELRSRGDEDPRLPPIPRPAGGTDSTGARLKQAAEDLRRHLNAAAQTKSVDAALTMLATVAARIDAGINWPAEADALALKGSGNAFKAEVCGRYRDELKRFKQSLTDAAAGPVVDALDQLLRAYGEQYRRLKRERSALDFEDLQLLALKLLRRPEIGEGYRRRFKRLMVDETQDTNAVQFALIDAISDDNLFMVGDAQQSIYGFRHADVELFRARGRRLQQQHAHLRLSTNFRSQPSILAVVNGAFRQELGTAYQPLEPPRTGSGPQTGSEPQAGFEAQAGNEPPTAAQPATPLVELLRVPKDGEYVPDSELGHWRAAEAKVLAARIAQLIAAGEHTAGEIVILTRATTDFQIYERALSERGVTTYVVGGRGYWEQTQVAQLVAYLKALGSRADTDAWYAALLSPLCGLSLDGLLIEAANQRAGARSQDTQASYAPAPLPDVDAQRLAVFTALYERQRLQTASLGAEQLLHDVIAATGYDLKIAALPGGRRRLANVRKLLRLARDHEAANGPDLRGFLDWIAIRADDSRAREAEAPLAGEGIDAVRMMTVHSSKGLEFPVVCVADLGRERRNSERPMVRIGRSASPQAADPPRIGMLIKTAGYPKALPALDYEQLAAAQSELDAAEERRLFYVAMTRAEQRLILSGAANLAEPDKNGSSPIGWLATALEDQPGVKLTTLVELEALSEFLEQAPTIGADRDRDRELDLDPGPDADSGPAQPGTGAGGHELDRDRRRSPEPSRHRPAPPVASLSYSALSTYQHCHLRFRAQYILGLPQTEPEIGAEPVRVARPAAVPASGQLTLDFETPLEPETEPAFGDGLESGAERGTAIHELLAAADLRSPVIPASASPDVAAAVRTVLASDTFARVRASAANVHREQQFAFQHEGILMTGVFDVLIHDRFGASAEVIDYKSDALHGSTPARLADTRYGSQRLIYALAALGTGLEHLTLTYLFLEDSQAPVSSVFTRADVPELERQLSALIEPLADRDFTVTPTPGRFVCQGCPIRGTLCPHPRQITLA
jgi:ATP-dependent helicase/nuclease subunit A